MSLFVILHKLHLLSMDRCQCHNKQHHAVMSSFTLDTDDCAITWLQNGALKALVK